MPMTASESRCPPAEDLERLVEEKLDDADRSAVEAHVETCAICQIRLEQLVSPTLPVIGRVPVNAAGDQTPDPELDELFLARLRQNPFPAVPAKTCPIAEGREHSLSEVGPYQILGRLGRGGMGTVYRARHRELDKLVALKVLPANKVDESAVARFRNEMRAAGRLGHPNIVAAHDAGREGNTYYLAMDFVDGLDLTTLVERLGPLPIADACELARQAAVGLQHACDRGLAHRDVKPSNLMLARGGVVKVLDLGLARSTADLPTDERLTATGVLLGTADYIAPEQIDKAYAADARSDVYGLGCTLYFLLTGAPPFADRPSWLEKLRAHARDSVPPVRHRRPEVPAPLAVLLDRMLAKNPDDRPATPAAVAEILQSFVEGADPAGLLARADGVAPRPVVPDTRTSGSSWSRRVVQSTTFRYGMTAAGGALIALLAAAPFLGARHGQPTELSGDSTPVAKPSVPEKEPEGLRLTFGPHGPVRPDRNILPGEKISLEFIMHDAGRKPNGDVDLLVASTLNDKDGKKVKEFAPEPIKAPLPGGSTVLGTISYETKLDQTPGEYRVRTVITDKITGRTVIFEHSVYVVRPEFGAVRLRLTHDEDGEWPTGANLTVGQKFFLHIRPVHYALATRWFTDKTYVHITIKLSARDGHGKETTIEPIPPRTLNRDILKGSTIELPFGLKAIEAGEVTFVVEVEDHNAGKKAVYELPMMIHPARSLFASVK